jgi:hypothetical protein
MTFKLPISFKELLRQHTLAGEGLDAAGSFFRRITEEGDCL